MEYKNLHKINTMIVFALFIILLANLKFQFLDEEWTLLLYVVPMILFYFLRIDSRFFIIFAILFLVYAAITLALVNNEDYANLIAINAYYGLVAGVILQLVEHVKNRENLFYVKDIAAILFTMKISKTQLQKLPEFKPKHRINLLPSHLPNPQIHFNISHFLIDNVKPILIMALVFSFFEIITSYLYLTKDTTFTNYEVLWTLSSILFFSFLALSIISIILQRKN